MTAGSQNKNELSSYSSH